MLCLCGRTGHVAIPGSAKFQGTVGGYRPCGGTAISIGHALWMALPARPGQIQEPLPEYVRCSVADPVGRKAVARMSPSERILWDAARSDQESLQLSEWVQAGLKKVTPQEEGIWGRYGWMRPQAFINRVMESKDRANASGIAQSCEGINGILSAHEDVEVAL